MRRIDGRRPTELRPVELTRGFTENPPGSVAIRTGKTLVLCTASWEKGVPDWKAGKGSGWLTAEYEMLPASTHRRRSRNRTKIDGRTQEIQRLIGRSLRAVVDLAALGENTIYIDCDVLQADGGTRTASITGAYVALHDLVNRAVRERWMPRTPIREAVAAVSVGKVGGRMLVDLNYAEDVEAEVDMNVVMTQGGRFIEVQGTGEEATYSRAELDRMVNLATRAIRELLAAQVKALNRRRSPR